MGRFAQTRWARMSSGQYCLIRDLGLVKGGKGLRHHEVVLTLSCRGVIRYLIGVAREIKWREAAGRLSGTLRAFAQLRSEPQAESSESLRQPDIVADVPELGSAPGVSGAA
jgi:hypothetical protein